MPHCYRRAAPHSRHARAAQADCAVSLPLVILLTNKNVTTNCRRLKQRQPAAAAAAAAVLCAALRAALRETAVYKILMIHFNHKNRCFKVPPNDLSSQNDGLGHVK